jgi:hypothetical protein
VAAVLVAAVLVAAVLVVPIFGAAVFGVALAGGVDLRAVFAGGAAFLAAVCFDAGAFPLTSACFSGGDCFKDVTLTAVTFFGAAAILGAAPLAAVFAAAFCFGDPAAALAFLRAGARGGGLTSVGVTRPVLVLAMESSPRYFSIEHSIDAMRSSFQEGVTKLIAEGLPTAMRTPVGIRLPARWSTWKAVISSLSWLAT